MAKNPVMRRLSANAGTLSPLPKIQRQILAGGSESVVLIDGESDVLLVTRKLVAKNIELLHGLSLAKQPFVKPQIVGIDADLALLINPDSKASGKRLAKDQGAVFYSELWTKNVVYRLPRYDGTLENLKSMSFNEASILKLEITLEKAITFLHDHGLTHNDIAMKNIFYNGKAPNLEFYLGDFGSLSKNTSKTHEKKCQLDFERVAHIIRKAKEILEHKNKIRKKHNQPSQMFLPSFTNRLRARIGLSPIKLPTPESKKVRNVGGKSAAKKLKLR